MADDASTTWPYRPDYQGGSLLNLMHSLASALGTPLPYAPLAPAIGGKLLDAAGGGALDLAGIRQVVLLVIDGLGDDLLARLGPESVLARHRVARLTSVFPSTTASAIPTFLTGLAPQQHGLTGWHMWFAEIDRVLAVLPLTPHDPLPPPEPPPPQLSAETLPAQLFPHRPLSARLPGQCFSISPRHIANSVFNRFHSTGSQTLAFTSLPEMFALLEALVRSRDEPDEAPPDFIHAYYPDLDGLLHMTGTRHDKVDALFRDLDAAFAASVERLRGSDTLLLVTADHGFIDAPMERLIELDTHPEFAAMLAHPLCGERRVAYAYVKPGQQAAFERYVAAHFAAACRLYRSADFIAEGWFGPGEPHPQLASRAGDYVLLMREDWTIKDWLPGEKRYRQPGVHGGASHQEMFVPLIALRC